MVLRRETRQTSKIIVSLLLLAVFAVAGAAPVFGAAMGKVSGLVVDKRTKGPLFGVAVQLEGTTLGASTDADGRYTILSVPLGVHSIRATYMGYSTIIISEVTVKPDQTSPVNFEMEESAIELDVIRVVGGHEMIQMDQATTKRDVTAEKIKTLPVTNVGDILKTQVGVTVRNDRFHIRGGRSTELLYAVDGVTLSDPLGGRGPTQALNLSGTEIENISIVKGAWSPEYGGTSGIVNVATKEGDQQLTRGHVQYFTDNLGTASLNKFSQDYQRLEFTLGGPEPLITGELLPRLGLNTQNKLSYFLSLDFDRSNGAAPWHRYTSASQPAEFREIKFLGLVFDERQNNSGNALAKLTYRLTPDIRITGQYKLTYERNQLFAWSRRYTPNTSDWVEDRNDFVSLKWVHNLGPSTYYEILLSDFARTYWEKPGDPNKAGATLSPDDVTLQGQGDSFTDVDGNGLYNSAESFQDVYPDGQYNFGDIFTDRNGNGIFDATPTATDTTYDSLVFDFNHNGQYDFSSGEPFVDVNSNSTYDSGDLLNDANGNGQYDAETDIRNFDTDETSNSPNDLPESYVDGDRSLGEPFTDVNRNGVWDGPGVIPQYDLGEPFVDLSHDGKFQSSTDPWVPGVPYSDLNSNGTFDGGQTSVSGSWSNINANYDLGEPFIDNNGNGVRDANDLFYDFGYDRDATWHERKPRTRTIKADLISQMRREHEVKLGLSYSAYDLQYNELSQPYQIYLGLPDGGPFEGRGAIRDFYHQTPKSGAFYLVDKMEYGQMVAQVGFRYEYFIQSGDASSTADTVLTDSVGVEDYRDKFAPRVAFSYPISDRAKVFFNYGHFYQLPPLYYMYQRNTQISSVTGTIGNVNLDFVKTIKYEFGVQYILSAEYLLSVQGFYSDDFGRVSESEEQGVTSNEARNYYENSDYSRTRGLEVELDKKYGNFVSGSVTYDLSWAYGKSSAEALDYFENFYARAGGKFVIQEFPLDWDERHKVTLILDLRVPAKEHPKLFGLALPDNMGLNVFWTFSSGFPYTPSSSHPGVASSLVGGEPPLTNSERYPASSNVDIRFNKDFKVGPMDYTFEVWVNNLFDTRNIEAVYTDTGRPETGLVQNNVISQGFTTPNPTNWSTHRQIKLSLGMNF